MTVLGPCVVCGATDYALSAGGPDICPACDCGIPPEVTKLRQEVISLRKQLATMDISEDFIKLREENKKLRHAIIHTHGWVHELFKESPLGLKIIEIFDAAIKK